MFYHPEVSGDPVEMTLPGCEAPYPLDQWERLTKNLTLDTETWTRECQDQNDNWLVQSESRTQTQDVAVLILLVLIICLVFVIIPATFTASSCQRHKDYSTI